MLFTKINSKKEAVKAIKSNVFWYYMYGLLMLSLFLIYRDQEASYIYFIIGSTYIVCGQLLKRFMSKASAIFLTILTVLLTVVLYDKDIINVFLNITVIMACLEALRATFRFHKKIKVEL